MSVITYAFREWLQLSADPNREVFRDRFVIADGDYQTGVNFLTLLDSLCETPGTPVPETLRLHDFMGVVIEGLRNNIEPTSIPAIGAIVRDWYGSGNVPS